MLNIPETKGVPLEQMDALFAGFNGGTISGLFELIKSGGKVRLCSTAYCGWLEGPFLALATGQRHERDI